jgi:myosin heavy subunit
MSDELIYKVKLVADDKSLAELKKQVAEVESASRSSKGGGGGAKGTKDEVSALKELKEELKAKQEELAKLNKMMSENGNSTVSMIASQKNLGSEIQSVSQKIQEANRGYADQQTALSKTPTTLNELIEKQRALKIAASDVDFNSQQFIDISREYDEVGKKINELTATMKGGANEIRQYGTTLADLKLEQKTLATAIEHTPIKEQSSKLKDLKTAHEEVTAKINEFEESLKDTSKAQKEVTDNSDKSVNTLKTLSGVQKEVTTQYRAEVSELATLQARIDSYKAELANLAQIKKEEGSLTQAQAQAEASLKVALKETQADYTSQTNAIIANKVASTELNESYASIQARMKTISSQIKELNPAIDEEKTKREALIKTYNELNTKLKDVDKSMGNSQRNVGNYSSAMSGVTDVLSTFASGLGTIQGPLGPIAGRINSLATFIRKYSDDSKDSTKNTSNFTNALKGNIPLLEAKTGATIASSVATKGANIAIKGLNFTLKALRITLISLGIPAIALAVISLVQAFKRTEEGAQKLRVITAGFNQVLEVFKDILSAVGRSLIEAFENPQQAIKDLGEAIKQNLINRVMAVPQIFTSAIGVIAKGAGAAGLAIKGIWSAEAREESKKLFAEAGKDLVEFIDSTTQLATGVEDPLSKLAEGASNLSEKIKVTSALAKDYESQMNAVLVREREINVARAEQNRDLQEARGIARDMEVDAKTRLKAILEVGEAERTMAQQEIANEKERLRIMEDQKELSDTSESTLQAIAEQKAKIFNLEASSLERIMRLTRDRNSVERQIREEAVRRARFDFEMLESQEQRRIDTLRTNLEREGRLREALEQDLTRIKDTQAQEQARLEEVYLTEFLSQKFNQEDAARMAKEKAENELADRIYNAQKNLDDRIISERKSADAFDRGLAEQRRVFALKQAQDELSMRGSQLQVLKLTALNTEEEIARRRNEIRTQLEQEYLNQGIEPREAARRADADAQMQVDQEVHDYKMNNMRLELESRITTAQTIANALGAFNSAIFNDSKELAVAQTIANTYAGAMAAFKDTPGNIAIRSLAAAAAVATGIANVKKILATKLGDKGASKDTTQQPNITTGFGLVDVGTNAPIASQVAMDAGMPRGNMNPTFVFQGDLDPEIMAIKVNQGRNAISGNTIGIG